MRTSAVRLSLYYKKLVVLIILLITALTIITPCFRNLVLFPVWPYAWREMTILDAIELRFFTENTLEVESAPICLTNTLPRIKPSDLNRKLVKNYDHIDASKIRSPDQQRFLPSLTVQAKWQILYTYMVLAEILNRMQVEFFFVQGSLLGVHRHKGLIPWDDDIDLAVNVSDWKTVRRSLSCIEGFVLSITNYMHWKFFPNITTGDSGYPFVDIFFYTENSNFIWAVSRSTSYYLAFPKRDTFPLTTGSYEGLQVPVPKNTDQLLKIRYDYQVCQSPGMDHRTLVVMSWLQVTSIPCSSLFYLYDMYNFD